DHVVQASTVIDATAGDYRGLFQCAQPRRRFARVEYFGGMIPDGVNKLAGEGCNAAEALKKVQCDAFGLENRTCKAAHFDNHVSGHDSVSVGPNDLDVSRRIDLPKNFRGRARAGDDGWLAGNNASGRMQPFGDKRLGG